MHRKNKYYAYTVNEDGINIQVVHQKLRRISWIAAPSAAHAHFSSHMLVSQLCCCMRCAASAVPTRASHQPSVNVYTGTRVRGPPCIIHRAHHRRMTFIHPHKPVHISAQSILSISTAQPRPRLRAMVGVIHFCNIQSLNEPRSPYACASAPLPHAVRCPTRFCFLSLRLDFSRLLLTSSKLPTLLT